MLSDGRAVATITGSSQDLRDQEPELAVVRDIHAISPLPPPPRLDSILRSSSISTTSEGTENFATMSREFSALVVAGAAMEASNLDRIGEEDADFEQEINALAIVPDVSPWGLEPTPGRGRGGGDRVDLAPGEVTMQLVKKEEVEGKINAWQNSKVAKINNRFKCEEAIIKGWEDEQIDKAASKMKKVERKLEEKRAKAQERTQNEIAKAHRKADERRASAEAKRGTQVAKVVQKATFLRALGRAPAKRSFF